jgi:hypothetical protein
LKTAGIFQELWPTTSDAPLPSIFEYVGQQPLPDAGRVVGYLESGHVLIDMIDTAKDVFSNGERIINGSSILTDGVWLWRRDLQYYVRQHNVRLPEEFLADIRSSQYEVPELDLTTRRRCAEEAKALLFA